MKPHLETLEDRLTPTAFVNPFLDTERLTVSFATDAPEQAPPRWETSVLRALQAWSAVTRVNVALVSDSGAPLGTAGLWRDDSRFGDIRVGWANLSDDILATAVEFSPNAGTWAGDLIFNSAHASDFAAGTYDLFTVALHESGHIFALDHSHNPNSLMYDAYNGPHLRLGASDVRAIQKLYGARLPDQFDQRQNNDSLARATDFRTAASLTELARLQATPDARSLPEPAALSVVADLTSANDVDTYYYRTTWHNPGFALRLSTHNDSLMSARVTVFDSHGQQVGSAFANRKGDGVLRVNADPRERFYFQVESASGNFSVGAYRLEMTPDNDRALELLQEVGEDWEDTDNSRIATATALSGNIVASGVSFSHNGRLDFNKDYFRLRVPMGTSILSVSLDTQQAGAKIRVLNAQGQILVRGTTSADGRTNLQLDGIGPQQVFLVVSGEEGDYQLTATATAALEEHHATLKGTLSGMTQVFRGLHLHQSGLIDLELTTKGKKDTAIRADLLDAQGNVVVSLIALEGQTVRATLLLPAGEYTWRFVGGTQDGSPLPETTFTLKGHWLNDPIGPPLIDPAELPPMDPAEWLGTGFIDLIALIDPFGRPLAPIDPASPAPEPNPTNQNQT